MDGEEVFNCPRQSLREHPEFWGQLLLLYGFYKKGHLPDPGAVTTQSNSLMTYFRTLDAVNDDIDVIQEEERRKKAARNNRGKPRRR